MEMDVLSRADGILNLENPVLKYYVARDEDDKSFWAVYQTISNVMVAGLLRKKEAEEICKALITEE